MKLSQDSFKENFRLIANSMVTATSSHWSFIFFFSIIVIWLCIGFWNDFSESWQFLLHIVLAIVTFLMVLLIQHVQHRETRSMQIKLDELLKGVEGARNAFINIQSKPDHHLDKLQNESEQIAAKQSENTTQSDSRDELANEPASNAAVKIKTFGMSD